MNGSIVFKFTATIQLYNSTSSIPNQQTKLMDPFDANRIGYVYSFIRIC
jgi:hypothetical protein